MIRISSLCTAALAAMALLVAPAALAAGDPFQLVSVDDVSTMLGAPDVKIFDANGPDLYKENRLPGAILVEKPLANLGKQLPEDQTTRLVFYCRNPKWLASHNAAREAVKLGYSKVYVMPDGIDGWKKAGKPVEKG